MTYLLAISLLLNPATVAGCLWFLTRQQGENTRERDEFRRTLMLLIDHQDDQRKELVEQARSDRRALMLEAFRERQVLMERIQRPEAIPAQASPEPSSEPLHVGADDDKGYWQLQGIEPEGAQV